MEGDGKTPGAYWTANLACFKKWTAFMKMMPETVFSLVQHTHTVGEMEEGRERGGSTTHVALQCPVAVWAMRTCVWV